MAAQEFYNDNEHNGYASQDSFFFEPNSKTPGKYKDSDEYSYTQMSPEPLIFAQQTKPPPQTSSSDTTPPAPLPTSLTKHSKEFSNRSSKRSSTSRGPSMPQRRERERVLSTLPSEKLLNRLIDEEYDAKEAKKLLNAALDQLALYKSSIEQLAARERERAPLEVEKAAIARERADLERERRETLNDGLKSVKAVMDAQRDTGKAKQELGEMKMKMDLLAEELKRTKDQIHTLEAARDEAERAVVKARTVARKIKEETMVRLAREEARREGYEEGLRQGWMMAITAPPEPRMITDGREDVPRGFIEEFSGGSESERPRAADRSTGRRTRHTSMTAATTQQNTPAVTAATLEAEQAAVRLRQLELEERDRERARLNQLEREVERERAEKRALEVQRENERERERAKERELEREAEEERRRMREREERRVRELEEENKRAVDELARERERERQERERERRDREEERERERKERDAERERERADRAREREELERERERAVEREREAAAAAIAAASAAPTPEPAPAPLPSYLRMPSPPANPPPVNTVPPPAAPIRPSGYNPNPPSMPSAYTAPPTMSSRYNTPPTMPSAYTAPPINAVPPQPEPPVIPSRTQFNTVPVPPPGFVTSQPRTSSGGSQRDRTGRPRRSSVTSQSSTSTVTGMDLLSFPAAQREREMRNQRELSVIPEDRSVRASPTPSSVAGWANTSPSGFGSSPAPSQGHTPSTGYGQTPNSGFGQQTPSSSYGQTSSSGFGQAPTTAYSQPPAFGNSQPPTTGIYGPSSTSGRNDARGGPAPSIGGPYDRPPSINPYGAAPTANTGHTVTSTSEPTAPSWVSNPPVDYTKANPYGAPSRDDRDDEDSRWGSNSWGNTRSSSPANPVDHAFLNPRYNSSRSDLQRMSSQASSSSIDVTIQPPSGPGSPVSAHPDFPQGNNFLSPRHSPSQPLPPAIPAEPERRIEPPLPIRPRMSGYNGGDVPTVPNTPIAIDHSALPPGFQAMTITNPQNGATTPLYPMGNMSLPSGPAPSISSGPPAPQQQPQSRRNSIYGNPLRESERESTPRQFGAAGPLPPAPSFSYSPQPTGSPNLPVIPVIPGMNTGTPRGTPSQRISGLYASGTTPIMGTMGLPGGSSAGGGIYGRPGDGGPSNGPQRSPYSAVGRFQSTNDDDDADTDGFDPMTTHNTMLNAASSITMPEPVIPNADSGAKGKKTKKKKR